jgi:hypothetical protein
MSNDAVKRGFHGCGGEKWSPAGDAAEGGAMVAAPTTGDES